MTEPFTEKEILKAIKSLKNNKAAGIDDLQPELFKNSPVKLAEHIANLLNNIASTGTFPEDIQDAILTPLQKPGKKRGPIKHLRPLMLTTCLRKIMAICLIDRTYDSLTKYIPKSQAAYQSGRSTTEQVFAVKLLTEKAISRMDSEIHLLFLDMSAAFDCVDRNLLLADLEKVVGKDILFLISTLVNNTSVRIRVNGHLSDKFISNVGVAQGDCLSAILFIFYLACSITINNIQDVNSSKALHHHDYTMPSNTEQSDSTSNTGIDSQYADDLTWINTVKEELNRIKEWITTQLKARNLTINDTKTEEFTIDRDVNNNEWKKCKFLGTLIDSESDIHRRKTLANTAYAKCKHIFTNRNLSTNTKIRVFNVYVSSVFLYNSELWTTTNKIEDDIDIFQRKLLRRILSIYYPNIISNEDLYRKTNQQPWSERIFYRRLSWIGHLLRLDPTTPARKALSYYLQPAKRPVGGQKLTWIDIANGNLDELNIPLDIEKPETYPIVLPRKDWKNRIRINRSAIPNTVIQH